MTVICVSGEKSYKPNMVDLKFALVLENSLLVFPVIYVNSNMMLMVSVTVWEILKVKLAVLNEFNMSPN